MLNFNKKKYAFTISIAIILIALIGFNVYQYRNNKIISARVIALENGIQTLNKTFQQEQNLSAFSKQQLQELANRTNIIANSQNSMLTVAVAKVIPSVVSIIVSEDVSQFQFAYENPFGDDASFQGLGFHIPAYKNNGTTTRQEIAAGTGFFIRPDGYILTNRHVVAKDDAYYTVLLSSGLQKQAKVIYKDSKQDLAILKISGYSYPTVSFGDSDTLQLGETVSAIGNALGEYNNSVSVGVISGLDRNIQAYDENDKTEKLDGVIQTDASINSGNSGGPLFDLYGKVIGINVAIVQGANNVSFAIPINDLMDTIKKVLP